jgi:hypothetical protein
LGVWRNNYYHGFSSGDLGSFHDLAHDLQYAVEFLSGDTRLLLAATEKGISDNDRSVNLWRGTLVMPNFSMTSDYYSSKALSRSGCASRQDFNIPLHDKALH